MSSEFGKGFTYCIGLFLCHSERHYGDKRDVSSFFYAAADHLFELEIPHTAPVKFQEKVNLFKSFCLSRRLEDNSKEDVIKAVQEAKDILREWDEICGISTKKGDYE